MTPEEIRERLGRVLAGQTVSAGDLSEIEGIFLAAADGSPAAPPAGDDDALLGADGPEADGRGPSGPAGARLGRFSHVVEVTRTPWTVDYRAFDPHLQRQIALAVLTEDISTDENIARWEANAWIRARLSHPAIPTLYELDRLPDGRPYVVRQAVDGVPLQELLAQRRASPNVASPLARHVDALAWAGSGLAHAHHQGTTHGGPRSEHILVESFGRTWLVGWRTTGTPQGDLAGLGGILEEILAAEHAVGATIAEESTLRRVVQRARDQGYPSVSSFVEHLQLWLHGNNARARAEALVREADALQPKLTRLRVRAASLRARPTLEGARAADRLQAHADELERDALGQLRHALLYDPEHDAALDRLADHACAGLSAAENTGDREAETRYERDLLQVDRGKYAAILTGTGALTLWTNPLGASVFLSRVEERAGMFVAVPLRSLGQTPILALPLPHGSYVVQIRAPGRAEVRYTFHIRRGEHWDGIPPNASEPLPVWLPEEIPPEERYIPAGWGWMGGDRRGVDPLPRRRVWVSGFFLYAAPLADPVASYADAVRIAAALATRTGQPWRLPSELEWERAARGCDGRLFPWGNTDNPELAWTLDTPPRAVAAAQACVADRSPFDVLGLAGGRRDVCTSTLAPGGVARGGAWDLALPFARAASRTLLQERTAAHHLAVRPARSAP